MIEQLDIQVRELDKVVKRVMLERFVTGDVQPDLKDKIIIFVRDERKVYDPFTEDDLMKMIEKSAKEIGRFERTQEGRVSFLRFPGLSISDFDHVNVTRCISCAVRC